MPFKRNTQANWPRVLLGLSCLLFIASGLFVLDGLWRAHVLRVQSAWPAVQARIGECLIERGRESARNGGRYYYYTWCSFHYSVNGTVYQSQTRTTSTVKSEMVARMHRWISGHPSGHMQLIHYDPSDPKVISLAGVDHEIQTQTSEAKLTSARALALGGLAFLLGAWVLRKFQNHLESQANTSLRQNAH